jgi:hypothetical protein
VTVDGERRQRLGGTDDDDRLGARTQRRGARLGHLEHLTGETAATTFGIE